MRLMARGGLTNKLVRHFATTKGSTPLHNAAMRGDVSVCALLLERKADPTLRNALGMTPLEQARWTLCTVHAKKGVAEGDDGPPAGKAVAA